MCPVLIFDISSLAAYISSNALSSNALTCVAPKDLMEEAKTVNDWVYPGINDGVYRCGFAQSQEAYDEAFGRGQMGSLQASCFLTEGPFG